MKLLVQVTLACAFLYNKDNKNEVQAEIHKMKNKLKSEFSVFSELHDTGSAFCFTISPGKVVLDKIEKNTLFHDYLVHFDFNTECADLCGDGCDFSIEITNRKPV